MGEQGNVNDNWMPRDYLTPLDKEMLDALHARLHVHKRRRGYHLAPAPARSLVGVRHPETAKIGASECAIGSCANCGRTLISAVVVLTNDNTDRRWVRDNAGNLLCAKVALAVYNHCARAPQATKTD